MLSPGTPVAEAAGFFEGFFEGAGQRLIYDVNLRAAVDAWLCGLGEETFTATLPLLRRVFSALDRSERRRLLDAVGSKAGGALPGLVPAADGGVAWQAHLQRLTAILTGGGAPQ
jgi:hypothetical protein